MFNRLRRRTTQFPETLRVSGPEFSGISALTQKIENELKLGQTGKMLITHHDLETELDDDWLGAAEMIGFAPASRAYHTDKAPCEKATIQEICIDDLGPVHRSVGIFRDSSDGMPARERVIKILRGFRSGEAIPPVSVVENNPGSAHRYKLTDGTHRLYCSIAVGFTHIPAVKGFDWDSLDQ